MRKVLFGVLFSLLACCDMLAQATVTGMADHLPRGTATDIKASDIQASSLKPGMGAGLFRLVSIKDGEYDIGIGVLNRAAPKNSDSANFEEHSQITEIYYIISGNATLVTGGTIDDMKPEAPNPKLGPSWSGTHVRNGVSREVGPGDVVVMPPNTPHGFTNFKSDNVAYLTIRVDPHHVLSLPPAATNAAASAH